MSTGRGDTCEQSATEGGTQQSSRPELFLVDTVSRIQTFLPGNILRPIRVTTTPGSVSIA